MNKKEINEIWKIIKRTEKRIDKLTDNWGIWVEESVAPSAVKTFSKLGYNIHTLYFRRNIWDGNKVIGEIDILIPAEKYGKKYLFVGEAKTNLSPSDVDHFLKTIFRARKYLPEYKDYKIITFIGGVRFRKNSDVYACEKGVYVFKPSGELMTLWQPDWFNPKEF